MANQLKTTEVKAISVLTAKLQKMSFIAIALWISLTVHLIILSVHFTPEISKMMNTKPTLDVVLVNAKTKTKPTKADVLAQANLDRGGNTEEDRQLKTSTPSIQQQKTEFTVNPTSKDKKGGKAAKKAALDTKVEKRVSELEHQADELMTQMKSTKKVAHSPSQASTAKDSQEGEEEAPSKIDLNDAMERALEIDKLEAQIAKQHEIYQKRPKRKELGARAQEYKFAMYEEVCRQKIEKFGNLNYPEAMRNKNTKGSVLFSLDIKSDGSIEKITIKRSSGNKIFDEAAINILRLAAPYPEFPPDIRKDADILGINRTMIFTREEGVESASEKN
ncbi:MAG: energy transducer TonB [Methylophilaceae bacterium]